MKILSPAKINLFLQIVGKRPDGYHDLFSLMCCVGLYDTVSMDAGVEETAVSCDHPHVPEDKTNLAFGAADLFYKKLKKNEGVKISIQKQIPVAAGLGGGSSNAAAVFLGLNRYYGYPFSTDELMSMGLSIGADVPFFIFRRPATASGIGEKLEVYPGLKKLKILLIFPGFSVSTATVYKNLNLRLTKCKKKLKSSLLGRRSFDPGCHLCNDLEAVVASKYPVINTVKTALLDHGALGALMSGSGPTVFGLFSDSDKASKANHALARTDETWQLYLADMITQDDGYSISYT
ncbi:MAG: 4-(cytidine 5'-diphospho)-2-C-methyl-D-erythritol kinase [Deltaproteobacteria bacterium]|nr:4-(cytidine 5'-diphospho)-2-C-methyl-D-erythritol kinase [Deltaproteobacteria bacterium]